MFDPFFRTSIKIEPTDPLDFSSEIKIEPNTLEVDYEPEIKIEENDKGKAYDFGDHNYVFVSKIEHSYAKRYEQELHDIGNVKRTIKNKKETTTGVALSIKNEAKEEIITYNDNNFKIVDDNKFRGIHKKLKPSADSDCGETTEGVTKKLQEKHKGQKYYLRERSLLVNKDLSRKPPEPAPGIPVIDVLNDGEDSETITACENKFVGNVEVPEQPEEIKVRNWNAKKLFKCKKCHYYTAHKTLLKNHVKRHIRQKLFECNQCDYKTIYKRILNQHLRIHMPLYKCNACIYNTTYRWKLSEHMRTHIQHEVINKCVYCEYKTSSKVNLNKHMRTHNSEKPYKCTECTYSGKQKYHLIIHLESHANVMPYMCKICLYRTKDEKSLMKHSEIHETSLNCSICGFQTGASFIMQNHMVKHARKESYRCYQCDFATWDYGVLASHKQSHLNIVCNEEISEQNFKMHRETHTAKCGECDFVAVDHVALKVHVRNNPTVKSFR